MTTPDLPVWTNYLDVVPEDALENVLPAHLERVSGIFNSLPEFRADHAYAPGKWTVRQVLGHVLVSQRVFVSRAVFIARGERQPLPGYDENAYAGGWPGAEVSLADLAAAYAAEAAGTRRWFHLLGTGELNREGVAANRRVRPEQLLRALIGHESHHLRVLRERYGLDLPA